MGLRVSFPLHPPPQARPAQGWGGGPGQAAHSSAPRGGFLSSPPYLPGQAEERKSSSPSQWWTETPPGPQEGGSVSCEGVPASSRPASSCYCCQPPLPKAAMLPLSCSGAFRGSRWSSRLRSGSQLARRIWCPAPSAPQPSVTLTVFFTPAPRFPPRLSLLVLLLVLALLIFSCLNPAPSLKPGSDAAFSKKSSWAP